MYADKEFKNFYLGLGFLQVDVCDVEFAESGTVRIFRMVGMRRPSVRA